MSAKQKQKQHMTTFSMTAQKMMLETVHKFKQLIKQTDKTLELASVVSGRISLLISPSSLLK